MRDVSGRNFAWIHGGIYIACDRSSGPKYGEARASDPAPCVSLQGRGHSVALCPACNAFVWHAVSSGLAKRCDECGAPPGQPCVGAGRSVLP